MSSIRQVMPPENVLDDMFARVTHGADASPYGLVPKAVLLVETEDEIVIS
jgi:D-lactate dehydrogenase